MKKNNKGMSKIITSFFLFTLISCATGSIIMVGKARPAITISEVSMYIDPPRKFETIGIIEASSDIDFSRQVTQDRVMDKLKSQAALVGANGVLLLDTGSKDSGSTGYFENGFYSSNTSEKLIAKAKAIFVVTE